MDSDTPKVILTVGGALAELSGIALIALDVHSARRDARRVLEARPEPKGPLRRVGKTFSMPFAVEGRQPDLDERGQILERQFERLFAERSQREDELRETLRAEIARTGTEAMKLADERDRALRAFISAQLSGGVRRGFVGAELFIVGVIASAIANLL